MVSKEFRNHLFVCWWIPDLYLYAWLLSWAPGLIFFKETHLLTLFQVYTQEKERKIPPPIDYKLFTWQSHMDVEKENQAYSVLKRTLDFCSNSRIILLSSLLYFLTSVNGIIQFFWHESGNHSWPLIFPLAPTPVYQQVPYLFSFLPCSLRSLRQWPLSHRRLHTAPD